MTQTVELADAANLGQDTIDIPSVLDRLVSDATAAAATSIGFPGATDLDHSEVMTRLGGRLWNNIGDSADTGGVAHTRTLERAVICWTADLLGMPADDRWGYVSSGGTEGNLSALHTIYRRDRAARIYYTSAAHYSVPKIVGLLGAKGVLVRAQADGEMDYTHLAEQLHRRRRWPAIVVATCGTTMTEAVDNTDRIRDLLHNHRPGGHLHVDAALSGIPLALDGRLRLDDASGIGSVAISGHKFLATPTTCGMVIIRDHLRPAGIRVAYTATADTTITGSRCGLSAALLWHAIALHGREGHRWRATEARRLAAYTVTQLNAVGVRAWRHPHAFTVVLPTPAEQVRRKWLLSTDGDTSHLICMPGITQGVIDAFVADLAAAIPRPTAPRPRAPADDIGLITTTH